ncbi:Small subunit processome component 20-like protein [Aphelenchoides fujianensis]|nr:Small subunit processome component 20-like protein [Aphelenchoides fujianensis]
MSAGTKRRKRPHPQSTGERERLFKYVPFSDQIARISMDYATVSNAIPQQVHHEKKTFFYEANPFLADINHEQLATYAQLLHFQRDIADSLKDHLLRNGSSARIALIEILIGFASDLREDFLDHLWDFFDVIIRLIETNKQEIELLDVCFRALAVFFKLQWRNLVKNLRKTLTRLTPLFSSNSHYIRRFIAESSSFLLRRAGNMEKIAVFLVERSLELDEPNNTDGTIQLFFNTIKGIQGQFQTGAPQMLNEILGAIFSIDEPAARAHGLEILEGVMRGTRLESAARESVGLKNVDDLCRLLLVWLEEREGRKFADHPRLLDVCTAAIESTKYAPSREFLRLCARAITAVVERSNSMGAVRGLVEKTVAKFGNAVDLPLILDFYAELVDLNIFDIWCMETIGKLVEKVVGTGRRLIDEELLRPILRFYFKHTIDRHPLVSALQEARNPTIDVSYHKHFRAVLQRIVRNSEEFDATFYPLASRRPPRTRASEDEELLTARLIATIGTETTSEKDLLNGWLLASHLRLMDAEKLEGLRLESLLGFLSRHPTSELALRTFELLAEKCGDFVQTDGVDSFGRLLAILRPALAHPIFVVRLLALRILKQFERFLTFDSSNQNQTVLDAMLKVEEEPIAFETHRERAAHLRRLKHNSLLRLLPSEFRTELQLVVVRFVLAQYFVNLTAFWPQIAEIAASFSAAFSVDELWAIFDEQLAAATRCIREPETAAHFQPKLSDTALNAVFVEVRGEIDENVNWWAFRLELLKLLEGEFAELAERKNRRLIALLFDVYEHEFQRVASRTRKHDDLTARSEVDEQKDEPKADQTDDVGDEEEAEEEQEAKEAGNRRLDRKLVVNTIKTLISILSAFGNLKTAFKAADLNATLNELLRSDDPQLQKAALNCLFAFKNKALEAYRENFEKLVDDKTFRDELVHFSVDGENTAIAGEHRAEVMPVLMRLLDGKMHSHTSRRGASRRPAIFRFVSGCLPDELEMFLRTIFWSLDGLIDTTSIRKTCDSLVATYDPHKTIALRRISSGAERFSKFGRWARRSVWAATARRWASYSRPDRSYMLRRLSSPPGRSVHRLHASACRMEGHSLGCWA